MLFSCEHAGISEVEILQEPNRGRTETDGFSARYSLGSIPVKRIGWLDIFAAPPRWTIRG
jgi:hypothetical protein